LVITFDKLCRCISAEFISDTAAVLRRMLCTTATQLAVFVITFNSA
jgi:hypothetical protein